MSLVELQHQALREIRELLRRFVCAEIDAASFVPAYRGLFAPFDPPDLTTGGLSEREREELALFIRFMGGWFGEDEESVPKRSDWQYGVDSAPYSWIDESRYRAWIASTLSEAGFSL